jgi:hypothetical protein
MKLYPKPRPPVRVPAFDPVPLRGRCDGWTPLRQAEFLGHLAVTRSVSAAARAVGMARETAYRLRRRVDAESFAAAWDAALGLTAGKRKVTSPNLSHRVETGRWRPVVRRGTVLGAVQKHDTSALLALIARLDRAVIRAEGSAKGHGRKSQAACQRPQDPVRTCPAPPSPATWSDDAAPI